MSTIRIGTTAFASITDALMAAKADSLILLGSGLFVPTSLAGSAAPRVTLKGAGPVNGTTLRNARVFDQGLDGGTLPLGFTIQDLRFDYTSGAQGAILLAPTATGLTLQNLAFTGPHKGAVGAEGTYINLSGSKNSTLSGLDVSLSAQAGYDPLTGIGGGAFLLFAGGDNLQILNSRFQEGGYGNSMQVLFTGNARIVGTQFSGGGVTKQVQTIRGASAFTTPAASSAATRSRLVRFSTFNSTELIPAPSGRTTRTAIQLPTAPSSSAPAFSTTASPSSAEVKGS